MIYKKLKDRGIDVITLDKTDIPYDILVNRLSNNDINSLRDKDIKVANIDIDNAYNLILDGVLAMI